MRTVDMGEVKLAKDMTPEERRRYVENHTGGYIAGARNLVDDAIYGEHIVRINFSYKWKDR